MRITAIAAFMIGFGAPLVAVAQTKQAPPPIPISAAPAVQPGTIETARKLIFALHLDESYDRLFKPIIPLAVGNILPLMERDPSLPETVRQELQRADGKARIAKIVAEEFMNAFRARYSQLQEATAREYAAEFSEDELRAILAFYSSGAGAKALKLMPEVMAKLQSAGGQIGAQAGKDAYERVRYRLDPRRGT